MNDSQNNSVYFPEQNSQSVQYTEFPGRKHPAARGAGMNSCSSNHLLIHYNKIV